MLTLRSTQRLFLQHAAPGAAFPAGIPTARAGAVTNICVMELGQRAQDPGGGEGDNTAQPPVLGMSIGAFQGAKPFQLWGWNMKAQAEHLGPAWGGSSHITECVLGAQTEPSVSLHTPGCAHTSGPSFPSSAGGTKGISWRFLPVLLHTPIPSSIPSFHPRKLSSRCTE